MFVAQWCKRRATAGLFEPEAAFHALADMGERDARDWLRLKQAAGIGGIDREYKFEILAVRQGVLQRRATVIHCSRVGTDRNAFRSQHGAATTLVANVTHVPGQAVADVDHGMEGEGGVELQCLPHAWREG